MTSRNNASISSMKSRRMRQPRSREAIVWSSALKRRWVASVELAAFLEVEQRNKLAGIISQF